MLRPSSPYANRRAPRSTRRALAWMPILVLLLIAPGCFSSSNSRATQTPGGSATSTSSSSPTAVASDFGTPVTAKELSSLKFQLTPIFTGLDQPLYLTSAGDGSGDIFILEKTGKIMVAQHDQVQSQPFLDLTSRVRSSGSEQGLLGLAFHPNYKQNGYLYVDYIDTSGNTVVARFTAASDRKTADPSTFKKILGIQQPFANHNGGQLAFGPDGYALDSVWATAASEGIRTATDRTRTPCSARSCASTSTAATHMPSHPATPSPMARTESPKSGPMACATPGASASTARPHDLYIGDVGQDKWEEVDFVPSSLQPGLNFGWNRMEGTHCYSPRSNCDQSGLTMPVAEYSHAPGNCAIIGGDVYRGSQFGSIEGVYFFTDYCSGTIWGLTRSGGTWTKTEVLHGGAGYSSIGEDGTGELYVTDLSNGTVYHLTVSGK